MGSRGDEESSWLLRTASTLQMQRLEESGRGWLAARSESTSLARGEVTDDDYNPYAARDDRDLNMTNQSTRSVGHSRYASQYNSRVPSRLASRVHSRAGSGVDLRRDGLGALTSINQGSGGEGVRGIDGPDFVDPAVFEEEDFGEGEEVDVDEGEMRRVVMGRARGWVDWAVGWMDFRGEEEWEGSGDEGEGGDEVVEGEGDEGGRRRKRKDGRGKQREIETGEKAVAGPAPQGGDGGVLADARWLVGVASRIIV